MLRARGVIATGVAALLLFVAGCGDDGDDDKNDDKESAQLPTQFNAGEGMRLPETFGNKIVEREGSDTADYTLPIAIHDNLAYATTPATLEVSDMETGELVEVFGTQQEAVRGKDEHRGYTPLAPIISTVNGKLTATGFFLTQSEKSENATVLEALSVTLDTHTVSGRTRIELTGHNSGDSHKFDVEKAYMHESIAVVTLHTSFARKYTYALDLDEEKKLWEEEYIEVMAENHGTLLVHKDKDGKNSVNAMNPRTGKEKWNTPFSSQHVSSVTTFGKDAAVVTTGSSGDPDKYILSMKDGSKKHTFSDKLARSACAEDAQERLVCYNSRYIAAFDDASGKKKWGEEWSKKVDNPYREIPYVTGVAGENIYGYYLDSNTEKRSPFVLDSATGDMREENPGIAPILVNEKFAVALNSSDTLWSYPAK